MALTDNISLPAWALNARGHELIEQIIANPPDHRIDRTDWGSRTVYRTYQQPVVAELKRMYADWWDNNYEGATSLPEQPDDLIRRAIDQAAELRVRKIVERDLAFALRRVA